MLRQIRKTISNNRKIVSITRRTVSNSSNQDNTLSNIRNTVLSEDGTTFEEVLLDLYSQRCAMPSMKMGVVAGKSLQPKFTRDKVYCLEKAGENYNLRRLDDDSLSSPEGHYIFIIPFSAPYTVLCAQLTPGAPEQGRRQEREGHTSFYGDSPVYFAGIMKFTDGRLVTWNNASGHFVPPAERRYNLLPHVKLMLPEALFHEFRPSGAIG